MGAHTGGAGREAVLAIVGGGASGALTAVNVLRRCAGTPVRILLLDDHGRHGLGQAYATTDPLHLLNACAGKMSALEDDPGHLVRWARARGLDVTGPEFLSRQLYGHYLLDVLADAEEVARPHGRLERCTGRAVSVTRTGLHRPLRVHLSRGGRIDADAVVLATGNRVRADWPGVPPGPRFIPDPWAPGALDAIDKGGSALVIGTGLTMIDIAVTLTGRFPSMTVYAASRHGLLPREHRCPAPPPVQVPIPAKSPLRLAELLRTVREAVAANDGDWQPVVDALRPQISALWTRLTPDDRRHFLRLLSRHWEIHRHRIPPATAARVAALRETGRLRILQTRLLGATEGPAGMNVHLDQGPARELRVDWLINGTGPTTDVTTDPFLRNLFHQGMAGPDRLNLGLTATGQGALVDGEGNPHRDVFTLGPTLRGQRYETTAIPEIRAQAAALAPEVLAALTTPRALVPA